MDHLPTEIYFNILRFVPLIDLYCKVSLINKHAHDIVQATHEDFWKFICFDKFHFQDDSKPAKQSWRDFSNTLGTQHHLYA